jgi:hypothetical protein
VLSEAIATLIPRAFISWSMVTPRQRGVVPSVPRSWRYMLHIGRLTIEMPAFATLSSVLLATSSA